MSKSSENINKAKLAMKLAEISALMVGIQKDGKNQQQKFAYIGYEQINALLSKYMLDKKVVIIPEITESQRSVYEYQDKYNNAKRINTVSLKATFEIIDCETGYTIIKSWEGEASDYNDKAFSKASTEIQKRFYAKLFNITSGEADADEETIEIKNNRNSNNNYQNNNYRTSGENPIVQKPVRKLTPAQVFDKKIKTWIVKNPADKIQKRDLSKVLLDSFNVSKLIEVNANDYERFEHDLKARFALAKKVLIEFQVENYSQIQEKNLVIDYYQRIEEMISNDSEQLTRDYQQAL